MSPKRARRRRFVPRLEDVLVGEVRDWMRGLEAAVVDLAGGEGAPPGFDARRLLVPGVPRIRPLLVLLSARAASPSEDDDPPLATQHVAVAAELLHLAVTVQEAALGRRGGRRRRAARRLLGGAVGALGGHHLSLRALEIVRDVGAGEIIGDLLESMREVAGGQALAQGIRGRCPTRSEAVELVEAQTGATFAFACRAGARLGGGGRPVVTALGRYGRRVGVAWWIAEDLGAVDEGGGRLAEMLEERAVSGHPGLSVILAAESDPAFAQAWRQLERHPSRAGATRLAQQLQASPVIQRCREQLTQESWAARKALGTLPASRHRQALDRIAATLAR